MLIEGDVGGDLGYRLVAVRTNVSATEPTGKPEFLIIVSKRPALVLGLTAVENP